MTDYHLKTKIFRVTKAKLCKSRFKSPIHFSEIKPRKQRELRVTSSKNKWRHRKVLIFYIRREYRWHYERAIRVFDDHEWIEHNFVLACKKCKQRYINKLRPCDEVMMERALR